LVTFDLPYSLVYGSAMVRRATGHKLLVSVFQAVLADIKYSGLIERATHYGGLYNDRPIRGSKHGRRSTHSWGIAIDINPEENGLGTAGRMDPRIISVFERHGFAWGGMFKRCDPMHFQYATGY
jgi:hypothetical protein